jgi:hypothetical protein
LAETSAEKMNVCKAFCAPGDGDSEGKEYTGAVSGFAARSHVGRRKGAVVVEVLLLAVTDGDTEAVGLAVWLADGEAPALRLPDAERVALELRVADAVREGLGEGTTRYFIKNFPVAVAQLLSLPILQVKDMGAHEYGCDLFRHGWGA